jgi:CheY-like chemotaxis protein
METTKSKGMICIVEDNKPIAKLFATVLSKSGFQTVEFDTGQKALEWIENNTPDCVLTDILLPDMNGTELLERIRMEPDKNAIPVVAITGLARASDKQKFLDIGFDGYIPKPIDIASFASDIEMIIFNKQKK